MFKKHSLQVSVIKTPDTSAAESDNVFEVCSSDIYNTIIKDHIKNAAKTFVCAYALIKVMDTCSKIAINYAPKN